MGCSSGKPQRPMPAFKADIKSEGQLAGQHGFDLESAKKHIDVYEATTDETQPDAVASQWPDDDKTLDDAGWLKRIYWPIALLLWYERILSTFLWKAEPNQHRHWRYWHVCHEIPSLVWHWSYSWCVLEEMLSFCFLDLRQWAHVTCPPGVRISDNGTDHVPPEFLRALVALKPSSKIDAVGPSAWCCKNEWAKHHFVATPSSWLICLSWHFRQGIQPWS